MRMTLIKIGRLAYPEYRTMGYLFWNRLNPKQSFELIEVKDETQASKYLLQKNTKDSSIWVFDEKGEEFDSLTFSKLLSETRDRGVTKHLILIIGHPLGLSKEFQKLASKRLSMSKFTFTSDLAFLVICEQIYRAFEIMKGSGYHHA
jgi:23S rRNA (pseudouridine1915-N3)-methyltransferase